MGQEIVYCFKCQGRIVGAEFDRGQAFQLGQRFVCNACVAVVLPTLPLKERERLLADMFKATRDRHSPPSAAAPPPPRPDPSAASRKTTRSIPIITARPKPAPSPSAAPSSLLPAAIFAVAAVLIVGIWLVWGHPTGAPPEPPAPVHAEVMRPTPLPPAGAPRRDPQESAAREAVEKAKSFQELHPADVEGQVALWELAAKASDRTLLGGEAKSRLSDSLRRRKESFEAEQARLEADAKPFLAAEEYKNASDVFKSALGRHAHPDWAFALEKRAGEIYQQAARQLPALRESATAQLKQKEGSQLPLLREKVRKWGYLDLVSDLDQAIASAAAQGAAAPASQEGPPGREILKGRWVEQLAKDNCGWILEEGALVTTRPEPRSARTWDDFANGEFRIRFESQGSTWAFFNVRQSVDGLCEVGLGRPVLEALGPGEHVLVIRFHGSVCEATLDGKSVGVQIQGHPRTGALQFDFANGKTRVNSIEYRP